MPGYIVVTSDDLQPSTLPLFEKYWKPLKVKHPNLKVTFYVSPFNQEFGKDETNNIETSEEFKQWWKENKEWCTVIPHGVDHTKPPECTRGSMEQLMMIRKTKEIFEDQFGFVPKGWKSPFYRMSNCTIDALREEGFSWYSQWWNFIPLGVVNKRIPEIIEIPSHTNNILAKNPDNIDVFHDMVDSALTRLEGLGFMYATFDEIAKEVME